jgi:imidazole glycerol phosphate synthase glutamine amidotransferase subunit
MIQIINTGVANIRSLQAAFDRLGQTWNLTEDAAQIATASHVVLPGVGAFAAAADSLDRLKLREAITQRIENPELPTLCICLGMQLLCESSEEAETAQGLAIIPHRIQRFNSDVKVPQLGWNEVAPRVPAPESTNPDSAGPDAAPYPVGQAYFANSFRLVDPPAGWGFAETEYGGNFVSSIWRGRTLACQFHPELSGKWGQQVLKNWIEGTAC